VVSFGHGSDEEQEAELVVELEHWFDEPHAEEEEVVELLHGSETHGLELVVVCRLMALLSRAARALLGRAELRVSTDEST